MNVIWDTLNASEISVNIRVGILPVTVVILLTEITKQSNVNSAISIITNTLIKSIWKFVWVLRCRIFRSWKKTIGIISHQKKISKRLKGVKSLVTVKLKKQAIEWNKELTNWIKNSNRFWKRADKIQEGRWIINKDILENW